ncbi:unnamed protein product [Effrenium voratum]|nr:unnamed protein product [Effrenium voratum]
MDSERLLVPAFEDEARSLEQKEAREDAIKKETAHQMEFRKRIQERTRRMATVKTHMSYKSIVREYGEEAEEGNFLELLERFQQFFQPKRTLRPSGARRRFESSVKVIRVHVSVAKVYDAPLRVDHTAPSAPAAPAPPGFSSAGGFSSQGYPSFGLPPRPLEMVFGAQPEGVQKHQLPEIVIELTLQDFQGNLLFRRTDRAAKSTDPDINQILELPLHGEKDDLTQENLTKYSGELTINIFDELTQATSSGKDLRLRTQLRHLGRFVVPWDTLYSAKCSLKGHFLVDQYPVLFGYRPKARKKPPGDAGTLEKPRSMCLALDERFMAALEEGDAESERASLAQEKAEWGSSPYGHYGSSTYNNNYYGNPYGNSYGGPPPMNPNYGGNPYGGNYGGNYGNPYGNYGGNGYHGNSYGNSCFTKIASSSCLMFDCAHSRGPTHCNTQDYTCYCQPGYCSDGHGCMPR